MAFATPTTLAVLQSQLSADAHQLLAFVQWIEARSSAYQQAGITSAVLAGWGVSQQDQNIIFAFAADVNRLSAYVQGNPQNVASNMLADINNINGIS